MQSWLRKNPSNQLTQSLSKEDHADPCMACSSLEMKPEQQLRSRSSPTSEHQRLRKLPRRGSRGVKFRHGLAPGSEKVSDNDIVFRRYCTNRQEKFWSNLAHKHHHRGARTRRHAGNVALSNEKAIAVLARRRSEILERCGCFRFISFAENTSAALAPRAGICQPILLLFFCFLALEFVYKTLPQIFYSVSK